MNKTIVFLVLVISIIVTGCSPSGNFQAYIPERVIPHDGGPSLVSWNDSMCAEGSEPVQFVLDTQSLRGMVELVNGNMPSSVNVCFAIFNISHGNRTNMLYIKNGWGLVNLPVDVFVPWPGDKYIVGGLSKVAELVVIDEDTIVVDGGYNQITSTDVVDWSSVVGGVYKNEVRFESSRTNFVDGQRVWTATCRGKTFLDLDLAIDCGLGN